MMSRREESKWQRRDGGREKDEHKAEVAANPLMADCKSSVTKGNATRLSD